MSSHIRRPGLRCLLFSFLLASAPISVVWACNVPVFRYALEHWRPDAYRAVLFHRGPLSREFQDQLAALRTESEATRVNLTLRTVDLDQAPEAEDKLLFDQATRLTHPNQESSNLPRLVVQYPAYLQLDQPVWSGPFNGSELATLLDSPARQTVLQRLTAGQTAVWLMVDSGDPSQDDAAAATLETELNELARTLKLPELTDSPEDVIQDGPPVRLEFSLVRVGRDAAAEQHLITVLLGCEADLVTLNEPMVFPIFGRCRALLPLVGPGISAENIRSSAAFLAGACSCQVKELNPGFDLLITANWKDLLSWAKSPAFASLENPQGTVHEAELVPIPAGSSKPQSEAATEPHSSLPASSSSQQASDVKVLTNPNPTSLTLTTSAMTDPTRLIVFTLSCLTLAGILMITLRRS